MTRHRLAVFLILSACRVGAADPSEDFPKAVPLGGYSDLIRKSMFAPATPVVAPEAKASFAADLFVVGLAKMGSKDFVIILNRQTRDKFTLLSGEPGTDGTELASVDWADDPSQSRVTVRKGSESSVLEFDESAFKRPAAPQPAMQGGGVKRPPIFTNAGNPNARFNQAGGFPPVNNFNPPTMPNFTQPPPMPVMPALPAGVPPNYVPQRLRVPRITQ